MGYQKINWLRIVFFLSGVSALIYQIAWQRILFSAFGVDLESVTIIIAVFMAGLGVGAYWGGRIADRYPHKLILFFAFAELGIGIFGFVSPLLITFVKEIFLYSNTATIALANFILLLLPTFLMGSTLPLLTKYLNQYIDNTGNNIGELYFVNTFGAMSACILLGFVLFNYLTLEQVIYIAGVINCIVAISVFILYKPKPINDDIDSVAVSHEPILNKAIVLSFLGGFLSLGLEVIWIRLFAFYSSSIPQAFSLILALYLLGIAFGALIGKRYCNQGKASLELVGKILLISAIFDLVIIAILIKQPNLIVFIGVVGVAMLRGAIFPIVHHLGAHGRKTGAAISNVYFANVIGCTISPILIGFWLFDVFSTQQVYALIIAVTLGISFWCIKRHIYRITIGLICVPVAGLFILSDQLITSLAKKDTFELIDVIENKHGFVQIYNDLNNDKVVFGNNVYDGMLNVDIQNNHNGISRAYLLADLAPKAKDVLVIGLSTGSWVSVLANLPEVESITVIELNPAYMQLADSYTEMRNILSDKRIKIITDDGRRWLNRNQGSKFDFILMNTTFHWRNYATNLLSYNFLNIVKQHLKPKGFIYFNTTGSPDVLYTASQVYPYTYKYLNMAIGSLYPLEPLNLERLNLNLSKMKYHDGSKVFPTVESLNVATEILFQNSLELFDSVKNTPKNRKLEIITDSNMITEYKYGVFSNITFN